MSALVVMCISARVCIRDCMTLWLIVLAVMRLCAYETSNRSYVHKLHVSLRFIILKVKNCQYFIRNWNQNKIHWQMWIFCMYFWTLNGEKKFNSFQKFTLEVVALWLNIEVTFPIFIQYINFFFRNGKEVCRRDHICDKHSDKIIRAYSSWGI